MKQKRGVISLFMERAFELFARPFVQRRREPDISRLLRIFEAVISRSNGAVITSGPGKGHRRSDPVLAIMAMAEIVQREIERKNRGRLYDGNMALASQLGLILCAWYANVHRAKSYDPNRPLRDRRIATAQRARFMAELAIALSDDSIMGDVWGQGQRWNFPFGRGAKGGDYR